MKSLKFLGFIAFYIAFTASAYPKDKAENTELNQENFFKIRNSIFEMVRPLALEAPNITYKSPVPYDKLPHYITKNKEVSFGTAFAIDEKNIVTAAHVLNVLKPSIFLKDVRLKDQDGNSYEIDQIKKYSELEDYIVFTLKTYPKKMNFLKMATKSEIGQTVHAIGNALGEGIVERNGRVTSHTDEEMLGKWKYIRFTAPASPGNSGGPLVNDNAEVVGIIVRRSNDENLNYAVPIELLKKDNGSKANFYDRTYAEVESGERLFTPWLSSLPLPQKFSDFVSMSSKVYLEGIYARRKAFEKQFKDQIFPDHKNIQPFLREQRVVLGFSIADKDTNGKWENYSIDEIKNTTLPSGQKVYFGFTDASMSKLKGEVYLEKPKKMKLVDFISDPKVYFNQMVEFFSFYFPVAEEKLEIKSLGAPYKVSPWTDQYGRKWTTSFWSVKPLDLIIIAQCLPLPLGIGCKIRGRETWNEGLADYYNKIDSKRILLSYTGTVKEWEDFLSLPAKWKPESMSGLKIDAKKMLIEDSSTKLSLKLPEKFNDKSEIGVYMRHALNLKKEQIGLINISVREDKPITYMLERLYDATKSNSDEFQERTKKFFNHKEPYDCKMTETNETYEQRCIVNDPSPLPGIKSVLGYTCWSDKDKSQKEVEKLCTQFKQDNGLQ